MITKLSLFIGHGYEEKAGTGRKWDPSLQFHTYLILRGGYRTYTFAFAYCDSLQLRGGKMCQLIDIHEDSLGEPLPETVASERKNEDSDDSSANSIPGDQLSSGMNDVKDE